MNKPIAYFQQKRKALPNSDVSADACWDLLYSRGFKRYGNKCGVTAENFHAKVLKIYRSV
jgi:hypothetical protein